jgi:hypothetical protein
MVKIFLRSLVLACGLAALTASPAAAQLHKFGIETPVQSVPAPFALLAHASVSSSSGGGGEDITTGAIDTTGAKLIVCMAAYYNGGGAATVNDSKTNSWTARTLYGVGGNTHAQIYYAANPSSVGAGHTFTLSRPAGSLYPSFGCMAFSAGGTVSYDAENGNGTSGASSLATGTVTPATTNEVLISMAAFGAITFSSVDSGFSSLDSIANSSSNHYGFVDAYLIETTGVAKSPTWSFSGSADIAVAVAAFRNH